MRRIANKKITIIGARQAGLALGIGLQQYGYSTSIVTSRDWRDVSKGIEPNPGYAFSTALDFARRLGINYWESRCPQVTAVSLGVQMGATAKPSWTGRLGAYAQALDQRLTLPHWMQEYERLGGKLILGSIDRTSLENYAAEADLTIIGAGRRAIAEIFPISESARSPSCERRIIMTAHVLGRVARPGPHTLKIRVLPGLGEYATLPALTSSGPCDLIIMQAIPGSALDSYRQVQSPSGRITACQELLETFVPDEAERCRQIQPVDGGTVVVEDLIPQVRQPVGRLSSGRPVLALGDAAVLIGPLMGLGASGALRSAEVYLDSIIEHGDSDYDEPWMQEAFNRHWRSYGRWARQLAAVVAQPNSSRLQRIFHHASTVQTLADDLARGLDDPGSMSPWLFDDAEATRYLDGQVPGTRTGQVDSRELRRTLGQFATGVAIVATKDEQGKPHGLTVNSLCSVSLDPPLVLWCGGRANPSLSLFQSTSHFSINVLSIRQSYLAAQFAQPALDKFSGVSWRPSKAGMPWIDGATAHLSCRKVSEYEGGDHLIFVGEIEELAAEGGAPLVFHSGTYQIATRHYEIGNHYRVRGRST